MFFEINKNDVNWLSSECFVGCVGLNEVRLKWVVKAFCIIGSWNKWIFKKVFNEKVDYILKYMKITIWRWMILTHFNVICYILNVILIITKEDKEGLNSGK